MVDFHCKTNNMPNKSPKLCVSIPSFIKPNNNNMSVSPLSTSSDSNCTAYEHYLRLPELRKIWTCTDSSTWQNEAVLKPSLQALEITFRLISLVLSDKRSYLATREWTRRLESLATSEIEIIASLCEDDIDMTRGKAPIVDLMSTYGIVRARDSEVWKIDHGDNETSTFAVNKVSEESLLPRLATWRKAEDVAQKIMYTVECEFRRCPYTLGIGEPNLSNKPNLEYDDVCRPNELHLLKVNPYNDFIDNSENQILYTSHQILESWNFAAQQLIKRIGEKIEAKEFHVAVNDCFVLEKIWKVLTKIEELHMLMDPDDFLHLKSQLMLKCSGNESFCFRSRLLVEIAKGSKNLRHYVPLILSVEVDPTGGPRIQDAAMRLYKDNNKTSCGKVHLFQAFQAIEFAMKTFFFAYKQILVIVLGSLEANGNRIVVSSDSTDPLTQIFLEPTYYPSLDAAKTFLGEFWSHEKH
ncbi:hypothetical protein ACFE04_029573 [Oxalis oulophora]